MTDDDDIIKQTTEVLVVGNTLHIEEIVLLLQGSEDRVIQESLLLYILQLAVVAATLNRLKMATSPTWGTTQPQQHHRLSQYTIDGAQNVLPESMQPPPSYEEATTGAPPPQVPDNPYASPTAPQYQYPSACAPTAPYLSSFTPTQLPALNRTPHVLVNEQQYPVEGTGVRTRVVLGIGASMIISLMLYLILTTWENINKPGDVQFDQ
ncbi:hypothetical protein GWK47_039627 [Chionoecetes opilio]|uniref:Uncharacterized protein n=1 Tax=Chionoecetes opilio TaxID=41210 RepID=A0A8J4YJ68_CHIOP|nr:hypothetical protein GWK47_039627 [Chionoecetes opilio]